MFSIDQRLPPPPSPGDAAVRCEQLDLLLQWGAEFRQSSSVPPEGEKVLEDLVAFDVILGDLNFDNCSSGTCPHQQDRSYRRGWAPPTPTH